VRIIKLSSTSHENAAAQCAESLAAPGAVALVPTETVYGLVCDWNDAAARERVYKLKHRADNKPLAAFMPSPEAAAKALGSSMPEAAEKAAKAFCPGPITVVVPDGKGSTFGFRVPDHPFVLALLLQRGAPLASTSANLSGKPAALSVEEALGSLDGEPDLVVDGGPIDPSSLASTVVQFTESSWKILRPGPISQAQLETAISGR